MPSPFQLNTATGEATTSPFSLIVGSYVIAVKVEEYRRINSTWTLIGSITRDITYLANPGGNTNPTFTSLQVGAATQPFEKAIRANPGQTISVTLDASDADAGQMLSFSTAAATVVPGVSLQTVSATQSRLTWQVPANLPLGRYYLPVTVTDNGCPLLGSDSRTLTFLVTSQVLSTKFGKQPLSIFATPTPFREQVQFQLGQAGTQTVSVLDGLGRTVAQLTSKPDGSVVWQPAASLAPGIYVARTADGRQVRLLRE
ncbi:hypothetical protein [Hymenobacter sublimis]|uniref:T9SS type A sorting domain-containing protein n=1 Tax=Hymenobacter sublimis TaxID=2933777 RepID=A0ABY4J8Z5_9BACT|nr:hypothetical protein [Hymenobacter sublimis]UPL48274.1 hypothetical protein MWH26_13880 [Hymenobacter sublimis]